GVGFDERRSAFSVTAPAQLGRLRRGVHGNQRRRAHTHDRDNSRSPVVTHRWEEKAIVPEYVSCASGTPRRITASPTRNSTGAWWCSRGCRSTVASASSTSDAARDG